MPRRAGIRHFCAQVLGARVPRAGVRARSCRGRGGAGLASGEWTVAQPRLQLSPGRREVAPKELLRRRLLLFLPLLLRRPLHSADASAKAAGGPDHLPVLARGLRRRHREQLGVSSRAGSGIVRTHHLGPGFWRLEIKDQGACKVGFF
uniref:Uncharacterized protein n=1 Tax=Mustela putorius furo TaxID=9669 RepID=M3Z0B4_MUSPF